MSKIIGACKERHAKALGYKNTIKAIKQHYKEVAKRHLLIDGGNQTVNFAIYIASSSVSISLLLNILKRGCS